MLVSSKYNERKCHYDVKLTILGTEPPNIFRLPSAPGDESIPLILIRIPRPVIFAFRQSRSITLQWCHWKHNPLLADSTVMDNTTKRRRVPAFLGLHTVGIDRIHDNIARPIIAVSTRLHKKKVNIPLRACQLSSITYLITVADHFSGIGIEFRMRGESRTQHLSLKIIPPNRLQRLRIHRVWRAIFFGRQQHTPPEEDICIGRGADYTSHSFIVCIGIAVFTKQRFAVS